MIWGKVNQNHFTGSNTRKFFIFNILFSIFTPAFITSMYILIQETTPLAGSSAGAIVCAVVASGASMQEALKATKILAEDCRNRGTAFRLGVCHSVTSSVVQRIYGSVLIFLGRVIF